MKNTFKDESRPMKNNYLKTYIYTCVVTCLFAFPAIAHHSTAMFDNTKELVMTGTVTRFDFINPHSWLYIDIKDAEGTVTNWGFEFSASSRLRRVGHSPKFWKAGDLITVKAYAIKDGRPVGALRGAITKEGVTYNNIEGLSAPKEN